MATNFPKGSYSYGRVYPVGALLRKARWVSHVTMAFSNLAIALTIHKAAFTYYAKFWWGPLFFISSMMCVFSLTTFRKNLLFHALTGGLSAALWFSRAMNALGILLLDDGGLAAVTGVGIWFAGGVLTAIVWAATAEEMDGGGE